MSPNQSNSNDSVDQVAQAFVTGRGRITVLTGAGVSTDSGLPDFRGRDGLWVGTPLGELLSAEGIAAHPDEFTAFSRQAIAAIETHKFNLIHELLAELQKAGIVKHIITQNVDGYHSEAGAEGVIEAHGSMRRIICGRCQGYSTRRRYKHTDLCDCGGRLRPDVVLFGENLDPRVVERGMQAIEETDLLVVMGTTIQVEPTSLAPGFVKSRGGKIAVLNGTPTQLDDQADFVLRGPLSELTEELYEWIEKLDRGAHNLAPLDCFV